MKHNSESSVIPAPVIAGLMLLSSVLLFSAPETAADLTNTGTDTPERTTADLTADLTADTESGKDNVSALPAYYNLAETGRAPTVRSQGKLGTCWAICACSAIESDLLPERSLVLSPDHMSQQNGYTITQEDGGDYFMIMSYLADWKGPVTEAEDPYGDGVSPAGLKPVLHVQEMRLLRDMTHDQIKQEIILCGAAQSSLSLDRKRTDSEAYHYYNAQTNAYYDPEEEALSHDILVLGWDDSFSRDNFLIRPSFDGAWICQNTWGEDFGDNGIFYVSYEDRNLFRKGGIVYNRIEDPDNYDHVYGNDTLGWQGRQGYDRDTCWFAGVFTAKGREDLAAIGLYSTGMHTKVRAYLLPEYTGPDDLAESWNMQYIADANLNTAGFYTIDLPLETELPEGQKFAVCVQITTEGAEKPVAVEMEKDSFTKSFTTLGRETYLSKDGQKWENTQSLYNTNVCLKVYTREGAE